MLAADPDGVFAVLDLSAKVNDPRVGPGRSSR